jgi:hypothetical protein
MLMDVVTDLSPAQYMNPGLAVTSSMLLNVIRQDMDEQFNTHELCEAVRRRYPAEYAEELIKNASHADPAKRTVSDIGSRLHHGPFVAHVAELGNEWTLNARGTTSRVALWGKK